MNNIFEIIRFLKSVTTVIKNCKSDLDYIKVEKKKKEYSQSISAVPPLGFQNSTDNNSHQYSKSKSKTNDNNSKTNSVFSGKGTNAIDEDEEYYIDPNWKADENGGYYDDDGYYYDEKGKLTGYYDEYGEYFEYTEDDLKQFYDYFHSPFSKEKFS